MGKIKCVVAVVFIILSTACSPNKKASEAEEAKDDAGASTPQASASSAIFTINGKTSTFRDVGAVGYQKENSITLNGTSGAEGETLLFTIVLKNIKEARQKFSEAGNSVAFTNAEANYSNSYKEDCTGKESFTDGTITITKLVDYTPEKDGTLEGNFEGQLSVTRSVSEYPCGNGKSSNSKTELVNVKGNFVAGYMNTKEVPL
ncbi:MAG: hypothetical protein H7Y86_06735 [Rhizobacter sp.]|nr:hypothetical protein [Ferruginibacter sp.]